MLFRSDTTSFDSNSNIFEATQVNFTIPSDQSYVDKYIRLIVISTDSRGGTSQFVSDVQQVVNVDDEAIGVLTIDGVVEEGATLTANTNLITDEDDTNELSFTYQWQLSDTTNFDSNSNIAGATEANFIIPSDQSYVDKYIRLIVISTDSRGGTTQLESEAQQIANVNDLPIFTSFPSLEANNRDEYIYNISVTDVDNSNVIIEANTIPSWLTLLDNGDKTAILSGFASASDEGDNIVILKATDTDGGITEQSFTINVEIVSFDQEITIQQGWNWISFYRVCHSNDDLWDYDLRFNQKRCLESKYIKLYI